LNKKAKAAHRRVYSGEVICEGLGRKDVVSVLPVGEVVVGEIRAGDTV
jgi:hypothetical protein